MGRNKPQLVEQKLVKLMARDGVETDGAGEQPAHLGIRLDQGSQPVQERPGRFVVLLQARG
jgi:hypothetical protein